MRIKKRELIIVIPFVFLLFQQAIIRNTTGMGNKIVSFVDEAYVAMLVLYCLWKKKVKFHFARVKAMEYFGRGQFF